MKEEKKAEKDKDDEIKRLRAEVAALKGEPAPDAELPDEPVEVKEPEVTKEPEVAKDVEKTEPVAQKESDAPTEEVRTLVSTGTAPEPAKSSKRAPKPAAK